MQIRKRWPIGAALVVAVLLGGPARAAHNPRGMIFRAAGIWRGTQNISESRITCEIPTINSAIADGTFSMGLWNTYGFQTLFFPDRNNPFGNPCGVFLELQNNLIDQAINIDRIELKLAVKGAKRFRRQVPTRNEFPLACRRLRHGTLFVGGTLQPINSTQEAGSGAPNVIFIPLDPIVSPEVIQCLRSVYAPLSTDVFVSLPLAITVTAFGVSDADDSYEANPVRYTLTLRHTCGNGRVDDGEFCDPNAPTNCLGFCNVTEQKCSQDSARACRSDADCLGTCLDHGDPSECMCVY